MSFVQSAPISFSYFDNIFEKLYRHNVESTFLLSIRRALITAIAVRVAGSPSKAAVIMEILLTSNICINFRFCINNEHRLFLTVNLTLAMFVACFTNIGQ